MAGSTKRPEAWSRKDTFVSKSRAIRGAGAPPPRSGRGCPHCRRRWWPATHPRPKGTHEIDHHRGRKLGATRKRVSIWALERPHRCRPQDPRSGVDTEKKAVTADEERMMLAKRERIKMRYSRVVRRKKLLLARTVDPARPPARWSSSKLFHVQALQDVPRGRSGARRYFGGHCRRAPLAQAGGRREEVMTGHRPLSEVAPRESAAKRGGARVGTNASLPPATAIAKTIEVLLAERDESHRRVRALREAQRLLNEAKNVLGLTAPRAARPHRHGARLSRWNSNSQTASMRGCSSRTRPTR